ncbi:MAG: hypothetical protein ACXWZQ_17365 [Candidatus Binatia bacterium]
MTILFSDLCELSAFARDNPAFGCGCSPTGEPLFPSPIWGKRVLLSVIICLAWANFSMRQSQEGGFQTRPYDCRYFLRPLRSLRPFFFLAAAAPRCDLGGEPTASTTQMSTQESEEPKAKT